MSSAFKTSGLSEPALRPEQSSSVGLSTALNIMSQGLCVLDADLRLIHWNAAYTRIYSFPPHLLWVGMTLREMLELSVELGNHPGATVEDVLSEFPLPQSGLQFCFCRELGNGRSVMVRQIPVAAGAWVTTHDDITEFRDRERASIELRAQSERAEAESKAAHARLCEAIEMLPEAIVFMDREDRLVLWNKRYAELYSDIADLLEPGVPFEHILRMSIARGGHREEIADGEAWLSDRMARHMDPGGPEEQRFRDGTWIRHEERRTADGGSIGLRIDITDLKRREEALSHLARHDALTGLANRVLFREKLEDALAHAWLGARVAVLSVDLDRFKSVNDTLGHPVGDALLKVVGQRLLSCSLPTDTVARLGGDEFAVLATSVRDSEMPGSLAQRIIACLTEPYEIGDYQINLGASVGIAVGPDDGADPDTLLKQADMALYHAKDEGRGTFRCFELEMDARIQRHRSLEADLRAALANNDFQLHFQPVLDLQTDQVTGFEALLRWEHSSRGYVSPDEFIAVAEEVGLIVPLGEWVIREACAQAAQWPASLKIAVNLSPAQFKSSRLVQTVISALAQSGLPPQRLQLEITETILLQDTASTLETLHHFRDLGIRIVLDDFGTGYSSLSYLRKYPFDTIKIDRSFVTDSEQVDSAAIIRAVAALGRALDMTITAEGVETEAQLRRVRLEGCTEAQGFLLGRPMRAEQIPGYLLGPRGSREVAAEPPTGSPKRCGPAGRVQTPGSSGPGARG